MTRPQIVFALGAVFTISAIHVAAADEPAKKAPAKVRPASPAVETPNLVAPTLGGNQVWEDEVYFGRWRIQRHVLTGHHRLLDPRDVRHVWGTLEECQRRLEVLKTERSIEPTRGKVVVMVHGLMGSRLMMAPLAHYVEREGEYTVLSLTYASTRAAVSDHAQALASLVASLDEATEIDFVAHSLGNLVVRHYMADCDAADQEHDPRIKRFVMIGPPNHGARCAVMLGGNPIFDNALGMSAQQLGRRWQELEPRLATPRCEFGVIAGGKGNTSGISPLLEGDDDGTVRVAETRLAGAADFTIVAMHHALLTANPTVCERTLRFLRNGHFQDAATRNPIPIEKAAAAPVAAKR